MIQEQTDQNICSLCQSDAKNRRPLFQLPIWKDKLLNLKYDIPTQLQGLTIGEQLLIQKYSTYIPVVHVRGGILGLQGHCISFPKTFSSICTSLPRMNCEVVRFIRHYGDKERGALSNYQAFFIRRKVVMDALIWLKEYNPLYRDDPSLKIDFNNLSWMNGLDQAELQGIIDIEMTNGNKEIESYKKDTVSTIQTDFKESNQMNMNYAGGIKSKTNGHYRDDAKK